ncbi:MAG: TetR family transcriptional regulator [Chloroflexi bacterium]|nr:TetR family transcriptional regulator [Chloroflexota bacterium]MBV9601687.1 TetR family transcriptional regulator [Chloroflexota bacterium]
MRSPDMSPERLRDAERTRAEILAVATTEFAERGYSGARVDEIADRTRTTKRMIYYYFGGKEQLYIAVLERAYAQLRDAEQTLDVEHLDPVAAIRELAELTFDHHEAHPDFLRLVAIENIHRAEHITRSTVLASINTRAVDLIARILRRGHEQGVFRREVDPLDVHMLISSFCVFRVANKHTFSAIFGRDLGERSRRPHYRKMLGDLVVAYLTTADGVNARPRRAARARANSAQTRRTRTPA